MSLDLTPEQKATGKQNFEQAAGDLARGGKMPSTMVVGGTDPKAPDRRDFLKTGLAVGAVVPVSAAVYYGYHSWKGNTAVRTALIGCGDEGGVLVGEHNPEFNNIVAVCDIRPSNLDRIFKGDTGPRKGLNKVYGENEAKKIQKYDNVDALLNDAKKLGLEAVIIATPLNTHDAIARKCMDADLHVLCEKLMARTITRCKGMIRYAQEKGKLLSIGHQRHYSNLYAQALELIENGILGDIKFIRALWHRNNSWPYSPAAFDKKKYDERYGIPAYVDSWWKEVLRADSEALPPEKLQELAKQLAGSDPDWQKYGFKDVAELVRWRCSNKTGGGLMAELGSHQLDASSIILGHVRPLAVIGTGGKFFYGRKTRPDDTSNGNDRESDDGVFVTYEFPGKNHPKGSHKGNDPEDIVVVTYSSMNTNEFESYGEWVMGSQGTMFLEKEANVYLWREKDKSKKGDTGGRDVKVVVSGADGKKPAMESTSTWGGGGGATVTKAPGAAEWDTAIRGYRTEMEHFAYCLRHYQKSRDSKTGEKVSYEKKPDGTLVNAEFMPRCHGEVAMADAIIALTANMAMDRRERIVFEDAWFDAKSDEVPETKYGAPKKA